MTYKPDVADLRESPALEIIDALADLGADVQYVDERIPELMLRDGRTLGSLREPQTVCPDLVLLHTRHSDADLSWIGDGVTVLDATYRSSDIAGSVLV